MRQTDLRSHKELELAIAAPINDHQQIVALSALGEKLSITDPQRSLSLARKAAEKAEALGDERLQADAYLLIARTARKFGNNADALNYYKSALSLYEKLQHQHGIGEAYCGIGVIYGNLDDQEKALKYYKEALKISMTLKDFHMSATNIGNIGNVHVAMGNYPKAIEYYRKAQITYEVDKDEEGVVRMIGNIGGVEALQGNYEEGRKHLEEALSMHRTMGNQHGVATVLLNLGDVHHRMKDETTAIIYLKAALEVSERLEARSLLFEAHSTLADVYERLGIHQLALEHFKQHYAIKKEVQGAEVQKLAANMELQRELDLKAQEAQLEKEKRTIVEKKNRIISQEKKRSEELLLNILPYEVAEELKANGKSEARLMDDVTVMFTDFKDFTLASEQLSPTELVEELDECFCEFDRIMERHGVEKIKTLGDAYMAAGGVPVANKTHVHDMIKAALEIQQFMAALAEQKKAAGKIPFQVRIGIHTGPVVAGIVGTRKFAYDIWGDTVNTASRMESAGVPGAINISEATYQRIKHLYPCEYRGRVAAKNKGKIAMYFLKERD